MTGRTNVTPTRKSGTPSKGDKRPDANMPANNVGTFPVKLGAGQSSQFAHSGKSGVSGVKQSTKSKANLPTKNSASTSVSLGTTMHGVGETPSYLKGK